MYDIYHAPLDPTPSYPDGGQHPLAGCFVLIMGWFIILIICGIITLLTSCTTVRYVPVETVRTDTVQIARQQRDSIYLHDSIYVAHTQRGDTVWMEVERWHTQYRDRWLHDSIYIAHTDSVPLFFTLEKTVPARLTAWQDFRLHLANAILLALLALLVAWLVSKRTWWLALLRKLFR